MKGSLEIPELLEDLSKVLWAQALAGEYVDSHVWVFTPSRVRLLMLDLYELSFISSFLRMAADPHCPVRT
jgi:hypothetical protein